MALSLGDKLGPYEIQSLLGKGGMGEVYKAHDTRLQRDVAIKTSAKQFSERFEREARAIAALNHPNICTLYDVGPNYLVMEYVEGEMLKGPIPLEKALDYARQIGSALEAAHEKGITHRDLKPGNIMLKPDGTIKVLDFGLAKFGGSGPTVISEDSPTLSMAATMAGTILGTAAYMAPEQARGKIVDKRADIWAFGVVLHEVLTGERLFKGEDLTETMAAVVMRDPDLAPVPHEVRRLLKKCLQKDPAKRLRDIGDVWELLDQPVTAAEPLRVVQRPASKLPWIAAGVGVVAALAFAGLYFTEKPQSVAADAVRVTLPPPPGTVITGNGPNRSHLAVSPDGRYVVFVADDLVTNFRSLWVRALGSLSAQKLDKTEGGGEPFWSPDSKNIAFFAEGKLKRVAVSGGSPINICDSVNGEGGTWFQQAGADGQAEGVILFSPSSDGVIQRVPASGGVPTPVTKLAQGELGHAYPEFLPDGKRFHYFVRGGPKPGVYVQTLGAEDRKFLLTTASRSRLAPPDYLLFMRDNTLLSQHIDWDGMKPLGEPIAVTDQVRTGGINGRNAFSVSSNGVMVYRGGTTADQQLRWYTNDGKPDGPPLAHVDINAIELSPDNKRAIIERRTGGQLDLWLMEFPSGVLSRLTSDAGQELDVVWSPDSRRIAYVKEAGGLGVYQMLIGSGKDSLVYPGVTSVEAWTRDGLLVRPLGSSAVLLLPAPEENAAKPIEEKPKLLLDVKYQADQLRVSPDGKWVTYRSRESGNDEVWVASFPGFTERRKVSGSFPGVAPLWRADGREIVFLNSETVMSVDVKAGATFEASEPKVALNSQGAVINNSNVHRYAMSKDGKRFLIREAPNAGTNSVESLFLILNWPSLLGK
jgi:Tol biopolymer transport system component/predicted Ser/Thr protein kinase